jgi:hypothetical protein
MLRITKNTNKIVSIQLCTKEVVDPSYKNPELDSFVIIPGVTQYNHIYSTGNWLVFDSHDSYIGVQFSNESDLDRFFTMLMREIKLNQLINVESKGKN